MGNWSLEIFKGAGKYKIKYALVVIHKPNGQVEVVDLLTSEGIVMLDNNEYAIVYYLKTGGQK